RALLPVLVALQDWGDRWLLGDGSLTGTNSEDEPPAQRLQELVGQRVPYVGLPSTAGTTVDVVDAEARATVLFGYPATGRPTPLPEGWDDIAGTTGCTLENRLFAGRYDEFAAKGIAVRGVSTQRPDEQKAFAEVEKVPHLLLSDLELELAAALRLPTFRAGGYERLKRVVLVVGADRTVQAVRYPVTDIADTVAWAFNTA
ncbi:MAG TPA: redoxin domain-containing protein, partial [Kribbella sp.]|nr:redoxin domain-containing protein [Kribbella sp.]